MIVQLWEQDLQGSEQENAAYGNFVGPAYFQLPEQRLGEDQQPHVRHHVRNSRAYEKPCEVDALSLLPGAVVPKCRDGPTLKQRRDLDADPPRDRDAANDPRSDCQSSFDSEQPMVHDQDRQLDKSKRRRVQQLQCKKTLQICAAMVFDVPDVLAQPKGRRGDQVGHINADREDLRQEYSVRISAITTRNARIPVRRE